MAYNVYIDTPGFHDPPTDVLYSCGGNANNFLTEDVCGATCPM